MNNHNFIHSIDTRNHITKIIVAMSYSFSKDEINVIFSNIDSGNELVVDRIWASLEKGELFGTFKDITDRIKEFAYLFNMPFDELAPVLDLIPPQISSQINLYFFSRPSDIAKCLKRHVKGQDAAVDRFSLAMYVHLLRNGMINSHAQQSLDLPKIQPFLIGKSGSGKTFMMEVFCKNYGVPSIIFDTSSLTASGYVGNNVSTIFSALYKKYPKSTDLAKAIICLDEFDKLGLHFAGQNAQTNDVRGKSVQTELLKIIDNKGADVIFKEDGKSNSEDKIINTKLMTFIFSGACVGLENIISQRNGLSSIGFSNKRDDDLKLAPNDSDLIKFGLMPELVGRISDYIILDDYSSKQLVEILKESASSPLKQYELFFELHNQKLEYDDGWLEALSQEAISKQLGVRGLYKVLNLHLAERMMAVAR